MPRPVFRPVGEQPRLPAVLAIHGGSWVGGSKSLYGPQLARLAKAGYVVFAADYRLARPGAPSWPEALDDLRAAVRWIRVHADEYHVDPERIVALGSSAGGCLALLLGSLPARVRSGRGFQPGAGGRQLLRTVGPRSTRGQPKAQTRACLALHRASMTNIRRHFFLPRFAHQPRGPRSSSDAADPRHGRSMGTPRTVAQIEPSSRRGRCQPSACWLCPGPGTGSSSW